MTEKRILLAALLSSLFLVWYAKQTTTPTANGRVQQRQQALTTEQATGHFGTEPKRVVGIVALSTEETLSLDSKDVTLEIGAASAAIRRAKLKGFLDDSKQTPISLGNSVPIFAVHLNNSVDLKWKLLKNTPTTAELVAEDQQLNNYHIIYELNKFNNLIKFKLYTEYSPGNTVENNNGVSLFSGWTKGDSMDNRYNRLEAFMIEAGPKPRYRRYFPISSGAKIVPRGTQLSSISERYFCQAIRWDGEPVVVKVLPSNRGDLLLEFTHESPRRESYSGTIYIGPRDYFHLRLAGFESAIPIGIIGKIGLILLLGLSWIGSATKNYGIAVILFSILVTCATAPFTILSFKSMKKMQELKPQLDKIMVKNKDNPKLANQEIFELYKINKVNPISGCLPMLLQMPIFIAMFQAISHFIDLRGKQFLWITDLSLPDRIMHLPFSAPIIGADLNLLPIIMAVVMYFQTKVSQRSMTTGATTQAGTLMSAPLMSVLFGIMFYQFPAGLVLYWLTNSVMSMVWYKLAA